MSAIYLFISLPVQRIHNLTLPHWATQDVQDTLRRVASFEVTYSISSHRRREKAKLTGGEGVAILWRRRHQFITLT